MDADKRLQQEHAPVADAAVPGQRASGEQIEDWLPGLEKLAELLDTVVVHARTCDIQKVGDDAQRWSRLLRAYLANSRPSAGPENFPGSV